jgi:hypothetical protein
VSLIFIILKAISFTIKYKINSWNLVRAATADHKLLSHDMVVANIATIAVKVAVV